MLPIRVAAAAATVVALGSAFHSYGHIWMRIGNDYRNFSPLTATQRRQAPATSVALLPDVFDWYASYLSKGDRYYVQVDPRYEPRVVKMLAGYYLLPAAQVETPEQATVVLSYYADPGQLGIRYLTQERAGLQLFFVSRIR